MDITVYPSMLEGTVKAIASKSQAHRLFICAAFADKPTELTISETNEDIEATVGCLCALGARIKRTDTGYIVFPVEKVPHCAALNCKESGSTLRFLLPVVGALGVDALFRTEGRLGERPISPLKEEMERMGCRITRPTPSTIHCQGSLRPGNYSIDGSVSSQFISGLLFACALMDGKSSINIIGKLESTPYVNMTWNTLNQFGITANNLGLTKPTSPQYIDVEGDWSNAAFFLASGALGNSVTVSNLNPESVQGDRVCHEIFKNGNTPICLNCADCPDLVPILSIYAAASNGGEFTGIRRLRLKESDRIASTCNMLKALGIEAVADDSKIIVKPGQILGGTVDSCNDHRIAMSAAIAATVAKSPVTILNAQCVKKSYPRFWDDFKSLGGKYEQYVR